MTITVYVGDIDICLADTARKHDASSTLINSSNYQNLEPGTYYTSIGDMDNLSYFAQILQQSDIIVYSPPTKWSDTKHSVSMMKHWTEKYLSIFCSDPTKTVIGFNIFPSNKEKMLMLADDRKSDKRQIWVAGCSISHGVGVLDHERYGELIAADLNQPVSFLTAPGSSIRWAADQILRSNIHTNDTIFWGLTSPARLSYWNESVKEIQYVMSNSMNDHKFLNSLINEKYLASDHMVYESIVAIYSVINFCKINGITLILATLLEGMEIYLKDFDNFVPLAGIFGQNTHDRFLDLGTDNMHPGPETHKFFKDKLLELYSQNKKESQ